MTTQAPFVNLRFFSESFKRFLPNSQAVSLAIILIVSFVLIYSLSSILMPVFASIVLAYLLEGLVGKAENWGMPRLPAVYLVFSGFMACLRIFTVLFDAACFTTSCRTYSTYSRYY